MADAADGSRRGLRRSAGALVAESSRHHQHPGHHGDGKGGLVKLPLAPVFAVACASCGLFTPASAPAITALGACIVQRSVTDAQVSPALSALQVVEDVAGY